MIDVQDALEIINDNLGNYGTETIALSESIGRILKEEWHTDRPLPPYNRVTMDGIAIRFSEFARGQRTYKIHGVAAAGDAQIELQQESGCLEVMTGAILPNGCDTVIRYEDLSIENGLATINIDQVKKDQNVHFLGIDRKEGEIVARVNTIISSAEIGLGASIGHKMVKVARLPNAIVISTGNELVPIDQKPLVHQIRKSNIYRISTVFSISSHRC